MNCIWGSVVGYQRTVTIRRTWIESEKDYKKLIITHPTWPHGRKMKTLSTLFVLSCGILTKN